MPKPDDMPDSIYSVVTMCWQADPEARPTFLWLKENIANIKTGSGKFSLSNSAMRQTSTMSSTSTPPTRYQEENVAQSARRSISRMMSGDSFDERREEGTSINAGDNNARGIVPASSLDDLAEFFGVGAGAETEAGGVPRGDDNDDLELMTSQAAGSHYLDMHGLSADTATDDVDVPQHRPAENSTVVKSDAVLPQSHSEGHQQEQVGKIEDFDESFDKSPCLKPGPLTKALDQVKGKRN